MNFSFLRHETTKLGPQRIIVKSSEVSQSPLLAVLSIAKHFPDWSKVTSFVRNLALFRLPFQIFVRNHWSVANYFLQKNQT